MPDYESPESQSDLWIWDAPAFDVARRSRSVDAVIIFLKSKGVSEDIARERAKALVKQARRQSLILAIPRYLIGGILVAFGISHFMTAPAGATGVICLGLMLMFCV